MTKKLRHLTDDEIAEIEPLAQRAGIPLDTCPTCGSEPHMKEWGWDRTPLTYKYAGKTHLCCCEDQILLRKHYLLARIPEQYMKLDWEQDFYGSKEVKKYVALYLDRWDYAKASGMGVGFGGTELGVGKSFGATHIAKELVKRGEQVRFALFRELFPAFNSNNEELERFRNTNILVLDEVQPPITAKQAAFYSEAFEHLIRHRTNHNAVTIMTTNLSEEDLYKIYPRTYSLLRAKQMTIDMTGEDARQGKIEQDNLELLLNCERRPIT